MLFGKNRRILFIVLDILALFFVGATIQLSQGSPQPFLFWLVWFTGVLIGLYLLGRYDKQGKHLLTQAVKVSIGGMPALLISYPFLSGTDTHRIMLLLALYLLTVIILSLVAYAKLHINIFQQKKQKSILFLLGDIAKSTRYQDFRNELERDGFNIEEYLLTEDSSLDQINFSQWDQIVYERSIIKNNFYAPQLLEEKIKGRKINCFVTFYSQATGRVPLELIDESYLLNSGRAFYEKKHLNRLMRVIDLFVGSILFVLLFIPALFIALMIRLESKGPVVFQQERVGKNLKPFILYKFRSMRTDAEKDGPQWAANNDPRATKVGSILRKTHLDEIPQILNVIRGDIGLVGPRPIRLHFIQQLTKQIPFYYLRNFVKPGITGWAQIRAPRGENLQEEKIKLEMDLFYLQNTSILMNLYIMLGTGKHMLSPSGNSHSNTPLPVQAK